MRGIANTGKIDQIGPEALHFQKMDFSNDSTKLLSLLNNSQHETTTFDCVPISARRFDDSANQLGGIAQMCKRHVRIGGAAFCSNCVLCRRSDNSVFQNCNTSQTK